MKSILYFALSLSLIAVMNSQIYAQPDLEVTATYVYELPYPPATPATNDEVLTDDTVAIGLDVKNNGPTLNTGDTIIFMWTENAGTLTSVMAQDFLSGNSQSFIVIQAQLAPSTTGPWEVCIWPTHSSKGFNNSDPNVGRGCKEVTVKSRTATGLLSADLGIDKMYFSGNALYLELSTKKAENISLEVFSSSGQKVHQTMIQKGSGRDVQSIGLNHLNAGMYVVRLTTQEGQVVTEKFMK